MQWIVLVTGVAIVALFALGYTMPFRLDDVVYLEWASRSTLADAWDPERGAVFLSFRPVLNTVMLLLSAVAGSENFVVWHLVLVSTFVGALYFTSLTARYVSGLSAALPFSFLLFWIAFLQILNVFFWFSDLTFSVELLLVTSAWYYGLRGMLEGRLALFALSAILATLGILAKEPAIVLYHCVIAGVFVLRHGEVRNAWQDRSSRPWLAILFYLLPVIAAAVILLLSPTRHSRFLSLSATPWAEVQYFVQDRLDYYASVLLATPSRLLLFFPGSYLATGAIRKLPRGPGWRIASRTTLALILTYSLFSSIPLAAVSLVATIFFASRASNALRRPFTILLAFAPCAIAVLAALLITLTLSKSQLTELAYVLVVIAGASWAFVLREWSEAAAWSKRSVITRAAFVAATLALITIAWRPLMARLAFQEQLLSDVRDVRFNANDAVKWCAKNLPENAMLGVAAYELHGMLVSDLAPASDVEKLRKQYTFAQGYSWLYLKALHRDDVTLAFLDDPKLVPRVLDSMRQAPNQYLFLQTEADVEWYRALPRRGSDTLIAAFNRGPFPAEIWQLRK